jgi:hypothetical protein
MERYLRDGEGVQTPYICDPFATNKLGYLQDKGYMDLGADGRGDGREWRVLISAGWRVAEGTGCVYSP